MELDSRYRWYKLPLQNASQQTEVFYFRGITAGELRKAGTKRTKYEADNFILSSVVLPYKDWDLELAGTANRLLSEIYKYSGLTDESLTFTEAINWVQSEHGALEAAAVAMIPCCSLELLHNCDQFDYAKYLIMGKFQFETMYGIPVEQAFVQQDSPALQPQAVTKATPGPGEIATEVENSFTWSKK